MSYFSQIDPLWKTKKLGFGKLTIGAAGCAITSISNLHKFYTEESITPDKMNEKAKKCGAFNVDLLSFPALAAKLGYTYKKQTAKPKVRCIAETNYYAKVGVPQHFFFWNPENEKRIDPLDLIPSWETNNYPVVSYRVFSKIETPKVVVETKPVAVAIPVAQPEPIIAENIPIKTPEIFTAEKTFWQKLFEFLVSLK